MRMVVGVIYLQVKRLILNNSASYVRSGKIIIMAFARPCAILYANKLRSDATWTIILAEEDTN
jgi:hypothetical protein